MGYSKKVYKKVKENLEYIRRRSMLENEKRKKQIYVKCPRIKDTDKEISRTSLRVAKIVLSGANVSEELNNLKERNKKLNSEKEGLLKAMGYPGDYLARKYRCRNCKDEGYVNGKMCFCFKNMLKKYAYEELNQLSPLSLSSFNTFDVKHYSDEIDYKGSSSRIRMTKILEFCKRYAAEFNTESKSLFFQGEPGLGKTHLSLAIARVVIDNGFGVVYGSVPNIINKLEKERFNNGNESSSDTEYHLTNCDLLILDDLGSEFSTSFSKSAIHNIINSRILMNKPTIISSNLSSSELGQTYSARVLSRIMGNFIKLTFVGDDMRQIKGRFITECIKKSMVNACE